MRRTKSVSAAVLIACAAMARARAGDSSPSIAVAARLTQDAHSALLVFDLSRAVAARAYPLTGPDRVVVDLPDVNFQIDGAGGRPAQGPGSPLVKAFRYGVLGPGKARIVIDLARPACPGAVEAKPILAGADPARLSIELKACDAAAFAELARAAGGPREAVETEPPRPLPVIVLDPGHGGADGGAQGAGGVQEKALVFAFCDELRRQLEATRRFKVVMTRDSDVYVVLEERVKVARDAGAALFVSVHADTLAESAEVSGATVYTAAERASDAEAARIAARENAADRAAGVEAKPADPGVADILFDLERRETRAYAHLFSRGLVDNLRGATKLNHNPERSAGFVVLKAPDFPSVLIELGYLSNPQDVQSLSSPAWRVKTAAATEKAIEKFFAAGSAPPAAPVAQDGGGTRR